MDRALLVMAKQPLAGMTKTRLSPPLSGQQTVDLYRSFLLDTFDLMRGVASVQPIVAYHPDEAEPFFRALAPAGFEFMPQVGADLGERLDHVLTRCLQDGYRHAIVTDSDSPTLPRVYLEQAFRELDDPAVDVVLGPCDDGGYYLIGLKSPCPALFRGMVMSTPTVLTETVERAQDQGLHVACLPSWYDVDTYRDLVRLTADLASLPAALALHTRAFLAGAGELPGI